MSEIPLPDELEEEIQREAKALYRSIYRKLYFQKYYERNQAELRKNALSNYHKNRRMVSTLETSETSETPDREEATPIRIERRPITINLNLNSFYIKRENG